jgi:hypothetical protein
MKNAEEIQALLATFFDQVTPEKVQQAREVTGIAQLAPGTLAQLLASRSYGAEDLITLLLADAMVRQEALNDEMARTEQLEKLCSHQRQAIDKIADQSLKLRRLIAPLLPDNEQVSSFDMLKDIVERTDRAGS